MIPLPLNPLPSVRADEVADALLIEREGFVDEAVVLAMANTPLQIPVTALPQDLAMTLDEMDYAGWRPPAVPPAAPAEIVASAPTPPLPAEITPAPAPPPPSAAEPEPAVVRQENPPSPGASGIRRATPPEIESDPAPLEIEEESSGWWLAWLAGILTASAICLLLYFLATGSLPFWPAESAHPAPQPPAADSRSHR
jgi:hypothetical protein